MFVVIRSDGKYVAPSGSERSYTDRLEQAQTYGTRGEALRDCCAENEVVRSVDSLLYVPRAIRVR